MKKNQGISLISLIITIIVIIILAAIVIFSGFGTISKAQLADYTQQVASLNEAAQNSFAKLFGNHNLDRESRTAEQIYYEVATGVDMLSGDAQANQNFKMTGYTDDSGCGFQPITVATAAQNVGISLPEVRNVTNGWCITSNGQVFNASGFYDSDSERTYFSASVYSEGQLDATSDTTKLHARAEVIAAKIMEGNPGEVEITEAP